MFNALLPSGSRLLRATASMKGATRNSSSLKAILASQMDSKRAALVDMKKKYGHVSLGEVTVDQAIGGARGVKCMLWETSNLDPNEGIRFRGYTIPDIQKLVPAYKPGGEPIPEALMWLLLTSEIPTKEQTEWLTAELQKRSALPAHVEPLMRSLPHKTMHPMTQFKIGLMACQTDSKFAEAYRNGVHKTKYW